MCFWFADCASSSRWLSVPVKWMALLLDDSRDIPELMPVQSWGWEQRCPQGRLDLCAGFFEVFGQHLQFDADCNILTSLFTWRKTDKSCSNCLSRECPNEPQNKPNVRVQMHQCLPLVDMQEKFREQRTVGHSALKQSQILGAMWSPGLIISGIIPIPPGAVMSLCTAFIEKSQIPIFSI